MAKGGWIKLHRSIMDNSLYDIKPFDKCRAWIDLLLLAESETHKKMWRGNMVEFKRGDVCLSIQALANRWGWSRKKTAHYLEQLQRMEMVHLKVHRNRTIITIVKWDNFQSQGTSKGTSKDTSKDISDGTKKDTSKDTSKGKYQRNNNKEYKEEKEKKESEPSPLKGVPFAEEDDEPYDPVPVTDEEWEALPLVE